MNHLKRKVSWVLTVVMVMMSMMTFNPIANAATDVAQGKTATASSTLSNYQASKANDADTTSRWCASGASFPQWWKVDLGQSYSIAGTSLTFAPSGSSFKYKIEASADGTTFTTITDKSSANYSGSQNDNFTTTARYIRITFTGSGTSDWASLSNVKVYTDSTGGGDSSNVSLGKSAAASSILSGYPASYANDSDTASRWCASGSSFPQWWNVDLGGNFDITGSAITLAPSGASFKYKIEVSTDGSSYTSKVDKTSANYSGTQNDSFTATARYIKITFTGSGTSDWASLSDVKVFGTQSGGETIPNVPAGLAATAASSNSINVTWNNVSNATGYDLEVDGGIMSNATSPYEHTGLTADSTHSYRVRAKNSAGSSAWSSAVSATTLSSSTLPPINNPPSEGFPPSSEDHREYMHGIDLLKVGNQTLLVFSSNNYPPTQPTGEWVHDIYYSWINPLYPNETLNIQTMVGDNLAQEPASAAVNSNGRIVVTAEDAQFDATALDQTFGMWDSSLNIIHDYGVKLMPPQGGHSGHVAASGDKFLVSFSDGWVNGGGVDNLGTGDEVYGKIINNDGTTSAMINTSVGKTRDWWPIVAGSDTNWLQVWQRYGKAGTGGGTVWGAIISQNESIVKNFEIYNNNKYYYYDVKYLTNLGLYLVIGSQDLSTNGGIAVLIDKNGNIIDTLTGLPNTVREGQTAIYESGNTVKAVYPTLPTGAAVLDITSTSISLSKTLSCSWEWDYMGVAGMFSAPTRVLFAVNSYRGVRFIMFDI